MPKRNESREGKQYYGAYGWLTEWEFMQAADRDLSGYMDRNKIKFRLIAEPTPSRGGWGSRKLSANTK